MRLGFTLFGVDVTLIDTQVMTEREVMIERWNELLDAGSENLSQEEAEESMALMKDLASLEHDARQEAK